MEDERSGGGDEQGVKLANYWADRSDQLATMRPEGDTFQCVVS